MMHFPADGQISGLLMLSASVVILSTYTRKPNNLQNV